MERYQLCWNQHRFLILMVFTRRLVCAEGKPDNSYPEHLEVANNLVNGGVQHVFLTSVVAGNLPSQFSPLPQSQREITPIIFQAELGLMFTIISLVTLFS